MYEKVSELREMIRETMEQVSGMIILSAEMVSELRAMTS